MHVALSAAPNRLYLGPRDPRRPPTALLLLSLLLHPPIHLKYRAYPVRRSLQLSPPVLQMQCNAARRANAYICAYALIYPPNPELNE